MLDHPQEVRLETCGAFCAMYCSAPPASSSVICQLCPVGLIRNNLSVNGHYTTSVPGLSHDQALAQTKQAA